MSKIWNVGFDDFSGLNNELLNEVGLVTNLAINLDGGSLAKSIVSRSDR